MAETAQFESDEFLTLLTDALRAGPGSPQWHEAVGRLRTANPAEADEYRLLIAAREHLESGREYRSVRAGAGFTRKVMAAIEQEAGQKAHIPSANIIAIVAAAGILGTIIAVAVVLSRGNGPAGTINDLAGTYYAKTAFGGDFSQNIPLEWRQFGLDPVISTRENGLRAGFDKTLRSDQFQTGGVRLVSSLPADQTFALDAKLRMNKPTKKVDLQLFITDDQSANAITGLVVDLRDGLVSVFKPDGKLLGEPGKISQGKSVFSVLIKMDKQFVIVECDGQKLCAGPHGLAPDKPRWPGLRFLAQSENGLEDLTVQSLRIMKP